MATQTPDDAQCGYLLNDEPLTSLDEDRLGLPPFAKMLAQAIVKIDAPNGFVVAVYGPWGSGKSTLLNFVASYLEQLIPSDKLVVVHFNPWWFSGQDQLLVQFFAAISSALRGPGVRKAMASVGERLEKFAGGLILFAGLCRDPRVYVALSVARGLGGGLKALSEALRRDVWAERKALGEALTKQHRRIIVIIDDIDRLPPAEVRDMFRVIKAVADLPKTIYLLAFDREAVVRSLASSAPGHPALAEPRATGDDIAISPFIEGVRHGDSYLEKIVQASYVLPMPAATAIRTLLREQLEMLLQGTPDHLLDRRDCQGVLAGGIDRLIRTPRDVKRYVNAMRPTYAVVRGEVYASDFLAIEALRVFAPEVYDAVRSSQALLAGRADSPFPSMDVTRANLEAFRKDHVASLASPAAGKAVHAILARIFPAYAEGSAGAHAIGHAGANRKKRRVCHPEAFETYFRLSLPDGAIPGAEMAVMLSHLSDADKLAGDLRRLALQAGPGGRVSRAREFLERLQDYAERDIPAEHIPAVVRALCEAGDDLLARPDKLYVFDDDNNWRIVRIMFQLIGRIPGQNERFAMLEPVVSQASSLGACVQLVHALGTQHGRFPRQMAEKCPEHACAVSREQLAALEELAAQRIAQAAAASTLWAVPKLADVLRDWATWTDGQQARAYVEKQTEDDVRFADLVSRFAILGYPGGQTDPDRPSSWEIDASSLALLAPLDPMRERAQRILGASPEWLSERQRRALEALVARGEGRSGAFQQDPQDDTRG